MNAHVLEVPLTEISGNMSAGFALMMLAQDAWRGVCFFSFRFSKFHFIFRKSSKKDGKSSCPYLLQYYL